MNAELITLASTEGWGPRQIAMLFVVVILAVLGPVITRKIRQWKEHERTTGANAGVREDPNIRIRRTADKAMVDLLETGREISAQLDTKIRTLNKLVKDAHVENTRLETLLRQAGALQDSGDISAPATPDAQMSAQQEAAARTPSGRFRTELHERIRQLHRDNLPLGEIARLTHLSLSEVKLALRMMDNEDGSHGMEQS